MRTSPSGDDGKVLDLTNNLWSIQYLRGIASVLVVYFHTKIYLADYSFDLPRQFGYFGVDIFFCISGFIMMYITSVRHEKPTDFLLKRAGRIYPLYWIATMVSVAIFLVMPSAFLQEVIDLRHLLLSLLLVPHEDPSGAGAAPILRIGWTLIFEAYFYLIFAVTLLLARPRARLLFLAAFLAAAVGYGVLASPQQATLRYATSGFILEFLFGAAIGYWALGKGPETLPRLAAVALVCLAVVVVMAFGVGRGDGLARAFWFGLPAACLVTGFVAIERQGLLPRSPLWERLGDASYSIYLFHPFVLTATRLVAQELSVAQNSSWIGTLLVLVATAAAVVAGLGVHRVIDRPLQDRVRRLLRRGGGRVPVPMASGTVGKKLS